MNATFDTMMGAMGFTRVNTKPCSDCRHSAATKDKALLACMYWNAAFEKPGESCGKWEAK